MVVKCPVCGIVITRLPVTFDAVERTQYGCVIDTKIEAIASPTIKETTFFTENIRYKCPNCDSPLHIFADEAINNIIANIAISLTKREE